MRGEKRKTITRKSEIKEIEKDKRKEKDKSGSSSAVATAAVPPLESMDSPDSSLRSPLCPISLLYNDKIGNLIREEYIRKDASRQIGYI